MNRASVLTLTLLFSAFLALQIERFDFLCDYQPNPDDNDFTLYPNYIDVSLNIEKIFQNGINEVWATYSQTREVHFSMPPKGTNTVAVIKLLKMANNYDKLLGLYQLNAIWAVRGSVYFPKFYGCAINKDNDVLLLEEYFPYDLNHPNFRFHFQNLPRPSRILIHLQMFLGLNHLWDNGFVHNDIRPDSIWTNPKNDRIVFKNLDYARSKNDQREALGTIIFTSPGRLAEKEKMEQKDDFYSLALTIAVLEAKNGYDDIFGTFSYQKLSSCFLKENTLECRKELVENVERVLIEAGYDRYYPKNRRTEGTFTSLICDMILYDDFELGSLGVIKQVSDWSRKFESEDGKAPLVSDKEFRELEMAKYKDWLSERQEESERKKSQQRKGTKPPKEIWVAKNEWESEKKIYPVGDLRTADFLKDNPLMMGRWTQYPDKLEMQKECSKNLLFSDFFSEKIKNNVDKPSMLEENFKKSEIPKNLEGDLLLPKENSVSNLLIIPKKELEIQENKAIKENEEVIIENQIKLQNDGEQIGLDQNNVREPAMRQYCLNPRIIPQIGQGQVVRDQNFVQPLIQRPVIFPQRTFINNKRPIYGYDVNYGRPQHGVPIKVINTSGLGQHYVLQNQGYQNHNPNIVRQPNVQYNMPINVVNQNVPGQYYAPQYQGGQVVGGQSFVPLHGGLPTNTGGQKITFNGQPYQHKKGGINLI